jgi:CRISPR-associated endoribonuclease Cas6
MPIAITLRLRPARQWQPDTHQLHGLACTLFEGAEGTHGAQVKRFSVWPVMADPADPTGGLALRCAWLGDDPPPFDPAAMSRVRFGGVPCTVVGVEEHKATFAELAASLAADAATLTFHSPTYFSQNGRAEVLPDPRLILGSYRRRWNDTLAAGSVLRVDDELWKQLHHAVGLSAFELRTAQMDSGHGRTRVGFVGTAVLRLGGEASAQVRGMFATLVRFAAYSGTGAQTTHGFGATTSSLDRAGYG